MGDTVGVAGATGALGGEVVRVLDRVKWRPDRIVAYARESTSTGTVDYGEERVSVDNLADADFGVLDALIVAVPQPIARDVVESAVAAGVRAVDASGVTGADADVPLVIPWVNPEALQDPVARGIVAVPSAPTVLLAGALGALVRSGVQCEVDATVLVPASAWGRAGMDELSRQVVTLFNSGTPPRKVFPEGFAFDLLPEVGDLEKDGWTSLERRVQRELVRLFGASVSASVTLVGVPLFSGIGATARIRTDKALPADLFAKLMSDAGLQMSKPGRATFRPRRVDGHPFVHAGRVREAPGGGGFHLWLTMDNLHACAAVAVACCGALLDRR